MVKTSETTPDTLILTHGVGLYNNPVDEAPAGLVQIDFLESGRLTRKRRSRMSWSLDLQETSSALQTLLSINVV